MGGKQRSEYGNAKPESLGREESHGPPGVDHLQGDFTNVVQLPSHHGLIFCLFVGFTIFLVSVSDWYITGIGYDSRSPRYSGMYSFVFPFLVGVYSSIESKEGDKSRFLCKWIFWFGLTVVKPQKRAKSPRDIM